MAILWVTLPCRHIGIFCVIIHKTKIVILTAVRTQDLIHNNYHTILYFKMIFINLFNDRKITSGAKKQL